jgi:hypothetical protein
VLTLVRGIDTFRLDAHDFMSRRFRSAVFDSCQPHASDINLLAYNNVTLGGLTTTSPLMIRETAIVRQHHHNESATMRLPRPRRARTSFGALTRDMQDYDFKARFESLPDSTTRLDTRGLVMREQTLGSSCLAYLVSAKEEARSKDT